MTKTEITKILLEYDSGEISTDKAIEKLSDLLSADKEAEAVGFAEWLRKNYYFCHTNFWDGTEKCWADKLLSGRAEEGDFLSTNEIFKLYKNQNK